MFHGTDSELTASLRDTLGAKLIAYLTSSNSTNAVQALVDGTEHLTIELRAKLILSHEAAAIVSEHDDRKTVQSWFQGMNPELDDISPARLIRDYSTDDITDMVLAAAHNL
jgi:hypothetical protein